MKYTQIYDGDMIKPRMRGYRTKCCGCGMVHVLDFFVRKQGRGHVVQFRIKQDKRATARIRKRIKKAATIRARQKLKGVPTLIPQL